MSSAAVASAVQGQRRFCARCGAPLRPGALFCHHCGNALGSRVAPGQAPPSPVPPAPAPFAQPPFAQGQFAQPQLAQPQLAQPQLAQFPVPPLAQPGAPQWPRGALLTGQVAQGRARRGWFSKFPPLGKVAVIVASLVLVGGLVQAALPGHAHCAYSCGPDVGPIAPAGQHYLSSLGFSFDYPSAMSVNQSQFGSNVTLQDGNGDLFVWAGAGQQSVTGLVQTYAQKISSNANFQNFTGFGAVNGAEIGFVPGQGEFYSADLQISGQETPVGIVVIGAVSGARWAVVAGWSVCLDPSGNPATCSNPSFQSGGAFASGPDFDDVLARWHWSSQ